MVAGRLCLGAAFACLACAGPVAPEDPWAPLVPGEGRTVQLRPPDEPAGPRRFGMGQLQALPPEALAGLWAGDLPLLDEAGRPGLLTALLDAVVQAEDGEASAAGQIWLGLRLEDVDWAGTQALGALMAAGEALGFDGVTLLAHALDVDRAAPLWAHEAVAQALATGLLASHPLAGRRPGSNASEGPVAAGALPLSVAELLDGGGRLAARLGPHAVAGAWHPGVVTALAFAPPPDDLLVTVSLARPPALHAALDLEHAALARVPAEGAARGLVDPADPDWVQVEGAWSAEPAVERLVLTLPLDPRPLDGRAWAPGVEPTPQGQADGWRAAPWTADAVGLQAAWLDWQGAGPRQVGWPVGAPTVRLDLAEGWLGLNGPGLPAGAYVWEALAEGARRLLADGPAVVLGGGGLPLGLTGSALRAQVVEALGQQPEAVGAVVLALLTAPPVPGASADVYLDLASDGPWLVAVAPAATTPGPRFFGDAALTHALDDAALAPGGRPRVAVRAGGVVYLLGDAGVRFRLAVDALDTEGAAMTVTRLD
ncbi:MAG: hypothetical protein H6702_24525 [Myxococcales bacterium]|nr:hypothetical protein [Myxococcales bacterium]